MPIDIRMHFYLMVQSCMLHILTYCSILCVMSQTMCLLIRLVVGQIDDLQIYCRYGVTKEDGKLVPDPTGCQQLIHLGKIGSKSKHIQCIVIP